MKAVILAGGLGTRISEETTLKPKPMVEIGDKPILWHIMKIYSSYGINDFIICLGYKGYVIKEYFANYFLHMSDVSIDIQHNQLEILSKRAEPWRVTLVDTGVSSQTGGRLRRVHEYLKDEDAFCFTYGDGLSNVNIQQLIDFHRQENRLSTVTGVRPPGRFGAIEAEGSCVKGFQEKPPGDHAWINGGFFVLSPEVIQYIESDETIWEQNPMKQLAKMNQMSVYFHDDFWQPMDTLRDKKTLVNLWESGKAPWKIW